MNLDTRTFLRVGYKQIPEVAGSIKWLFALPQFLEEPIISHEESLAIQIIEPPDLPPGPNGADKELFDIIKEASNMRKQEIETIANTSHMLGGLEKTARELWDQEVTNIEQFQQLESMGNELSAEQRVRMEDMRSRVNSLKRKHDTTTFEQHLAEKRNEIAEWRQGESLKRSIVEKIAKNDEYLKDKVTKLVNDKGASVRKSFALHCSARFLLTGFIDILIELVPANERVAAINDLDKNGYTPLHCALFGTPSLRDADMYYRAVQHLLGLRADKNIVDISSGRTPLGQYRSVIRSRNEFDHVFDSANPEFGDTHEAWNSIDRRMVKVLMPDGGETDADRDAASDQSSESLEDEAVFDALVLGALGDY